MRVKMITNIEDALSRSIEIVRSTPDIDDSLKMEGDISMLKTLVYNKANLFMENIIVDFYISQISVISILDIIGDKIVYHVEDGYGGSNIEEATYKIPKEPKRDPLAPSISPSAESVIRKSIKAYRSIYKQCKDRKYAESVLPLSIYKSIYVSSNLKRWKDLITIKIYNPKSNYKISEEVKHMYICIYKILKNSFYTFFYDMDI